MPNYIGLLLAEFLFYDKYDVSGYNTEILEMDIMSVLYILFSVILPSKYIVID